MTSAALLVIVGEQMFVSGLNARPLSGRRAAWRIALAAPLVSEVRELALALRILLVHRLEGFLHGGRLAVPVDRFLDQFLHELAGGPLAVDQGCRVQDVAALGRQSDVELWIVAAHRGVLSVLQRTV
jgi:hypothetical protein